MRTIEEHAQAPPPSASQETEGKSAGKGDLVEPGIAVGNHSKAQTKPVDVVPANPNAQKQNESITTDLVDLVEAGHHENCEESTHGDWLVVTRRKRNKPKNPRGIKSIDKDKFLNTVVEARDKISNHVGGPVIDKASPALNNAIKRGTGKRSRQEGKHATPTHILLRNAGIKDMTRGGASTTNSAPFKVSIQPGNFGLGEPTLKKDFGLVQAPWKSDTFDKDGSCMDMVPETQFAFDPGQTKFNSDFMKG
ncbi:hypothetical protein RIF29_21692 [Crotalaria pallida]|uniref:Uncharacterized protein n=1 Tax=Crotalaria pallida TaxID=3830 RepID=A0AAN9F3H8_CROPI